MELIQAPVEFVTQREEFGIVSSNELIEINIGLIPSIKEDIQQRRLLNPNGFFMMYFAGEFIMAYTQTPKRNFLLYIHKSNDLSMIDTFFRQNKLGEITGDVRDHFQNALEYLRNNPDKERKVILEYEKN